MKRAVSIFLFAGLLAGGKVSFGQTSSVLDGVYQKEHLPAKVPVQYTSLREADVMWSKRIWRTIDLREKINLPLYYPEDPINNYKSLFLVIKEGLMQGKLTAYDNPAFDDEFKVEMSLSQVKNIMSSMDTNLRQNLATGLFDTIVVPVELEARSMRKYWIKEDWFFDKQRSVLDVRIIGICPLIQKIDKATGDIRGDKPLFWLYFPQCRPWFDRFEVFNRQNDAERRTFDEIFEKRLFNSYVHKESNVYDRKIIEYCQGIDALLEAERVKNDMFQFEHDMWHL